MNNTINKIKSEEFLVKVSNLNNTMIESNVRMMRLSKKSIGQEQLDVNLHENIELIYNSLVDVILYYNRNKTQLSFYSATYKLLTDSWDSFVGTPASPAIMGSKLQVVKVNTENLIEVIKDSIEEEKYLS